MIAELTLGVLTITIGAFVVPAALVTIYELLNRARRRKAK